jgi:hypothetical protein
MKWIKYDPNNPPQNEIGKCLFWMLDYGSPSKLQYVAGVYDKSKGLLTLHGNKGQIEIIYNPKNLVEKKAHYIYPQNLEMPE